VIEGNASGAEQGSPGRPFIPEITSQTPCTWVSPRRGAQEMVVPLASAATQGNAEERQQRSKQWCVAPHNVMRYYFV